MKSRQRLSTKFFSFGLGLLILALLSIGLTMWVTRQLDGGAAAVNEAGRLRMQTWRLASLVQATAKPEEIAQRIAEFDHSLVLLEQGDQHRPLFVPWNEQTQSSFARLQRSWASCGPIGHSHRLETGLSWLMKPRTLFGVSMSWWVPLKPHWLV